MAGELGVLIPILAISVAGIMAVSRSPIGRAYARRLEGQGNSDLEGQVQELRQDLDTVRRELAETQERLDFTERALAQVREAQRLPRPPA